MKLHFDPNQEFQHEAIKSITGIFEGQPLNKSAYDFSLTNDNVLFTDSGIGNHLFLGEDQILENIKAVQKANKLAVSSVLDGMNFSVEMETGTGKTYVYKDKGIKVLSLFFIDRVPNYRSYDTDGNSIKGKFALWVEEIYKEISVKEAYKELVPFEAEEVHNGYFSQDKKGNWNDTKGNTQADDDTFKLMMKEKEKLLDMKEPLRFIFSHSALREGWDNPNVFQICTLNETHSELKKRQEIGRGLRLSVNSDRK